MTFAKRTNASWTVELNADCPYCGEYQDVMNDWHEQECWDDCKIGEAKLLRVSHGNEALTCTCCKCEKEFVVKEVEY